MTADDLAAIFKKSRRQVMEWQRQYDWPRTRVGRSLYWTPEQVEQIKARHAITPKGIKSADGRTARSARRSA